MSLDCSVYWNSLLEMRPVMLMFCTFWKVDGHAGNDIGRARAAAG